MINRERLYEAFGEIIYVVAMADGLIQPEETKALEDILQNHEWAKDIQWSFEYEADHMRDPSDIYKKALNTFIENGPDAAYESLFEILEEVAKASGGMDSEEASTLIDFDVDLRNQLIKDIEKHDLLSREG
ncbi:MAG: TerB family tellurite resistance protein [Bacteroidota bacterium]